MPVFNGEKFLKKRIESILSQTFTDFKLIISDNASTDSTQKICKEYLKTDNRISYIRQKKNIGIWENFNFVLQQANSEFFVWVAVDDLWLPEFLEKNFLILKTDESLIGSISKVSTKKIIPSKINSLNIDSNFYKFRQKILNSIRNYDSIPLTKDYNKKVRTLLKNSPYVMLYSIFRTNVLKKSMIPRSFVALDVALLLNLLKFGDIQVIDQPLLERFPVGEGSKGILSLAKNQNRNKLGIIFPHYPITIWSMKNIGFKNFLKNIDHYILLNLGSEFFLIIDVIRNLTSKNKKSNTLNNEVKM
ncbi:glycosyltransferase family 2 protein [Candidatus Nitrosopumilus sediminis]|uniref:glycosyltransferase family 2 protein n=1 Tax=Candidatus Nitrosopumilus sediminis TaxID=1229909 RepID=UPI001ED8C0D2|nr:glycosyltransferase family A protein [Candidatus Nitrosopumilus sediminis]